MTNKASDMWLERLARMHDEERRRVDLLMHHHSSTLTRIDMRLESIEEGLENRLTPQALVKLLVGLGAPVALLLTGNVELAKRLLGL
mgnify:CR=1 FL=1